MTLSIDEIYTIKCTIVHTLFLGRSDWRKRINFDVDSHNGSAYLEFRTASTSVTIDDKCTVSIVCTDGRKPVKFEHESIDTTTEQIKAELLAHVGRSPK
jgi:hypothetical protein